MNTVKRVETVYQVIEMNQYGLEVLQDSFNPDFSTKAEAEEFIKTDCTGKQFYISKVVKTRELIKYVEQAQTPCHGGWGKGHSPEDNEASETWCSNCKYKLKRITKNYTDHAYVMVKPLVTKEQPNLTLKFKDNSWGIQKGLVQNTHEIPLVKSVDRSES